MRPVPRNGERKGGNILRVKRGFIKAYFCMRDHLLRYRDGPALPVAAHDTETLRRVLACGPGALLPDSPDDPPVDDFLERIRIELLARERGL